MRFEGKLLVAGLSDAEAVCVDDLGSQVYWETGIGHVPQLRGCVHCGEDRRVGASLDLWAGPVQEPEYRVRMGHAADCAVALGVLLELGFPCQCLLRGHDISEDDAAR